MLAFRFRSSCRTSCGKNSSSFKAAWIPAVLLALWVPLSAQAGVDVQLVTVDHRQDTPREVPGSLLIEDGSMVIDLSLPPIGQEAKNTSIYRSADKSLVVVDHGRKAYSVMDNDTIGMIADEMRASMMKLEQRMATLPPEQRKLLHDAMTSRKQETASRTLKTTSEVATVAGYATSKYEVFSGDEKVQEIWVTEWKNIPDGQEVLGAMEGVDQLFREMKKTFEQVSAGAMGGAPLFDFGSSPFEDVKAMNGFPVRTRNYQGGRLISETRVESIETRKLEAATFQPPADYKKRVMNRE